MDTFTVSTGCSQPSRLAPERAPRVEAGTNIALEDPLRCIPVAQDREAVRHGVGRRSSEAKPIRVWVTRDFRDWIEGQQVQGLHGSIRHHGNAKGTLFRAAP